MRQSFLPFNITNEECLENAYCSKRLSGFYVLVGSLSLLRVPLVFKMIWSGLVQQNILLSKF